MKNAKKILVLLLSLTLVFTLFACGECEHVDENGDGVCELCEEEFEPRTDDVALITEGVPNFQFVVETGVSSDVTKILEKTIRTLANDYEIEVERVADSEDNKMDVEILIGDIKTRGPKYQMDKHSLGQDGYVIKIIDSKIVINAGSPSKLADAVQEFVDDILGLAEEPEELWDVVMTAEQIVEFVQSDYRITSLKINGQDMKGYTIAVDQSNAQYNKTAQELQNLFYTRAGYWFEIVSLDKADKSIILQRVEKSADFPNGFEISVNDKSQLIVKCAYDNMLEDGLAKLTNSKITSATGDVEFTTGVLVGDFNASVVYYEDFGAKGDGKTNDYVAIYNAHVKANEGGQTVYATEGKTYYIGSPVVDGKPKSIPVKTNTDWQNAKFIIDDGIIGPSGETSNWSVHLFSIEQDVEPITLSRRNLADAAVLDTILAAGLGKNTTKIDLGDAFRCEVMIITANSTHKVYRRKGYGAYSGAVMKEAIILDKDGNVRSDTSIMYDYIDLTGLEIIKLDEVEPITVKNAEFTNLAPQFNCITQRESGVRWYISPYISRGLSISRSKTTVENVRHYMKNEKQYADCVDENGVIQFVGATYTGFYNVKSCNDVTIKNCILTGKRCYRRPNGGTGGTYDLSAGLTNNLTFDGCVQSNFWITVDPETCEIKAAKEGDEGAIPSMESFPKPMYTDKGLPYESSEQIKAANKSFSSGHMHWGIGGTNLCKNTNYINSTLSRYDAHEGTYGGKIVGSTICAADLTGAGDFLIENTRSFTTGGERAFSVRSDFGYTWAGQVHLKNVSAIIHAKDDKGNYTNDIAVVGPQYGTNWYWGYNPTAPSIIIEDLYFYDVDDYDAATKTYAPVSTDATIYLWGKNIPQNARYHLDKVESEPIYSIEDKDKDGYIDVPDSDGDGVWGNTPWLIDNVIEDLGGDNYIWGGITASRAKVLYPEIDASAYGADANGLYENFSIVNPPAFVKIISNKGGYKYSVANTAASGLSNGGHYGVAENNKGFYGSTKFYYGPGENDFVQGPPTTEEELNKLSNYFIFY